MSILEDKIMLAHAGVIPKQPDENKLTQELITVAKEAMQKHLAQLEAQAQSSQIIELKETLAEERKRLNEQLQKQQEVIEYLKGISLKLNEKDPNLELKAQAYRTIINKLSQ